MILASGYRNRNRRRTGIACTTSPSELGLMMRIFIRGGNDVGKRNRRIHFQKWIRLRKPMPGSLAQGQTFSQTLRQTGRANLGLRRGNVVIQTT